MKKYIIIWSYLWLGISVQAQNKTQIDSLDKINTIKRDTSFIYAESTMKDAIEAQSGAKAILELKLQDWLRNKLPEEETLMLVSNSKEHWYSLLSRRGKYNRVFVYVAKQDVLPNKEKPEEVIMESTTTPEESIKVQESDLPLEITKEEETMAAIISFTDIEPYVKNLKEERKLRAYGKYASLPEDDPCYIFVYDRDGVVVAVIRQTEDGRQYNLRTKSDENVRNYKNCGAIWFQLK